MVEGRLEEGILIGSGESHAPHMVSEGLGSKLSLDSKVCDVDFTLIASGPFESEDSARTKDDEDGPRRPGDDSLPRILAVKGVQSRLVVFGMLDLDGGETG
jgi:hypothetical protein